MQVLEYSGVDSSSILITYLIYMYRLTKEGMVECKCWSTVAWIVLPY